MRLHENIWSTQATGLWLGYMSTDTIRSSLVASKTELTRFDLSA